MPLHIVRNDITKMKVDAIVNAANRTLLGGGGVDGAIHRAAGPELLAECRTLGGCETGCAKITVGYRLPSRYVIHTVGPVWHGGGHGERQLLVSCYRASMELAKEYGCASIAFPLISAGAYGYPKDQALRVAVDSIGDFLLEHDMDVYLVIFGKDSFVLGQKLSADIQEYIDDHYTELHLSKWKPSAICGKARTNAKTEIEDALFSIHMSPMAAGPVEAIYGKDASASLDHLMDELDESFQQMLLRKIDERGLTDAQCYKKANVDRKLFSKIRNDVHYKPSKPTAIAFAIALELDLQETESLLKKAGYALSRSSKFDVIVQYFIEKSKYNVFEINEALFYYDQNLLGA